MLVQLSYNSKSGKSTQFAVYEFPDHLSLNSAIYTLKRTGAKKANKENTKFQEIDSWNKNVHRWDSNRSKFISEQLQRKISYIEERKAQYQDEKIDKINAKIDGFFDTIEDFIVLHKPMCQSM